MGERLNLEIKENGKVLANSYYHWSGFTRSSIKLTQEVINAVETTKYESSVVTAIKLLETTGSGLTSEEVDFGRQHISDFDDYNFKRTTGRNDGLTAISEDGIKEVEHWEEERVTVNLDTKTIDFGAIWKYSKEEYEDSYEAKYEDVPVHDINFFNITFDKFEEFADLVVNLLDKQVYTVRLKDDEVVYGFVE